MRGRRRDKGEQNKVCLHMCVCWEKSWCYTNTDRQTSRHTHTHTHKEASSSSWLRSRDQMAGIHVSWMSVCFFVCVCCKDVGWSLIQLVLSSLVHTGAGVPHRLLCKGGMQTPEMSSASQQENNKKQTDLNWWNLRFGWKKCRKSYDDLLKIETLKVSIEMLF